MGESVQAVLERLRDMRLLDDLLRDRTTGRNIIWATDAYVQLGYHPRDEIKPAALFNPAFQLMSRAEKAREAQSQRTRAHAEVFTPLWIVRKMNDYVMADWFGCDEPFASKPVRFPDGKNWEDFIRLSFLEITCGEAPFLVTRYDVTTGEPIDLDDRVGILDRKLRIVFEHTRAPKSRCDHMLQAFRSTYGYELQGDNLLIARLNMLLSFEEYMLASLSRSPTDEEYKRLIRIITWNIWQMDGLTGALPYTNPQITMADLPGMRTIWSKDAVPRDALTVKAGNKNKGKFIDPNCRIYDWREGRIILFNDLKPAAEPAQLRMA